MDELDMIKAFTLLELQDKYPKAKSIEYDETQHVFWVGYSSWPLIDAIKDMALNCMARDKYEVEVDYLNKEVNIFGVIICSEYDSSIPTNPMVEFKSKSDILRVVVECILKSKGVYKV